MERFNPELGTLEIKLEQKIATRLRDGRYDLPLEGYLYFEAGGDMSQTERHQEALSILKQGRATNPLLGDFFFDARKARPIEAIQQLQPADLLSGTCNSGQIAAIEAALATRDLLLIQGPPGTGKTTVIAEICYQIALNGGRTLIASQSNLAVDNALGRIIHHPRVRALRKGNLETVEDEGRDYTEGYVVQKWLSNTANDCQAKLKMRQENIALFQRLLGETERFTQYHVSEVTWEKKHLSLRGKQDAVVRKIDEIGAQIKHNEEKEKKYASVQQALSALLAGKITWGKSEISSALQDAFQYLFPDKGDKQHFISQVNDGLQVVKQADLTPPSGGHLLMDLVWLKETAHTHNTSWAKSRQLISQMEDKIALLNQAKHLQEELAHSIKNKKGQMQKLAARISALQTTRQTLMSKMDMLQKANATLNTLPQDGPDSISSSLQVFIDAEFRNQLATPGSFSSLELEKVFPIQIIAAVHRDTSSVFLGVWRSAERAIQGKIQRAVRELGAYSQTCTRLARCRQRFVQELSSLPEISQELAHMLSSGYPSIPQDSTTFDLLITHLENNLNAIYGIRTKAPAILSRLFKGQERLRLQKLLLETRDLLFVANESQKSIPVLIHDSNKKFARNMATELSSSLGRWLLELQRETTTAYEDTLRKKDQLEIERQQVHHVLEDLENQLSLTMKKIDERAHSLAGILQDLGRYASIPEALRKAAQQNANSTVNTPSFIQEYRIVCQSWVRDIQRLEMLVNELWGELEAADRKIQQRLAQIQKELEQQRRKLSELKSEQEKLEALLLRDQGTLLTERQWWSSFWQTIPEYLRPLEPPEGIFALPLLEAVEKQFKAWASELAREEYLAQRYDWLIADWITHLHNLSEDEKRELQEVYIANANVIGITCGQAPKLTPRELRTFASFDTVIIDEVSKATAPELLLPVIKGKKLILIGDQYQLPPMIEDKTLAQMAEESGKDPQAYRFLSRSYFKERYNEAPDNIKRMLTIQYRMHPDIMAAINQFYERPLECGLNQPDIERDHQLESALVHKNKHIIWIATPLVSSHSQNRHSKRITARNRASGREVLAYQSKYSSFGDESRGTSFVNYREVEIIEKICQEFQQIWTLKKAAGAEAKEIGVITFYAAQDQELKQRLGVSRGGKSSRFDALNIRVSTVDRFQGMERAVILVSLVRNNSQGDIGFAKEYERINVAFSRAQQLLVIVGCHDLFCCTARYEEAMERYNNVSKIVKKRGDFIDVSCI